MFGLLMAPLVIALFVLRVLCGLTRCLLWACWQVAAGIITAALVFGAAWLFYRGLNQ